MNLDLFDRQVQALLDRAAAYAEGSLDDGADASQGLARALALAGEALMRLAEARSVLRELPGMLELARLGGELRARRYKDLFDLAPVAYLATDLDGTITGCNREASNLLGGDPATVVGRPIQSRLDGGGRDVASELDRLRRGLPAGEIAVRLRDGSGGVLDVVARVEARFDQDGEPAELLWLLHAAEAARPSQDRREGRTPAASSRGPLRPILSAAIEAASVGAIAATDGGGPAADEGATIRFRSLPRRAARRADPEDVGRGPDDEGERAPNGLVHEMRTPLSVILVSAHLLAEVGRGHPWLEAEAARVTRQARILATLLEGQRARGQAARRG